MIHGGQLLNGLAGPTIMSAGPFLSTTWFAPDQRATATAVATLFSYLGGAASFLVGPLVVPAPNDTLAGARLAAELSSSSIRGWIQLVMYAGTVSMQGPPEARQDRWHIISTSCQLCRGTQKQSGDGGSRSFPNSNRHRSASEKSCRLVGLSCLTGSEN